MTEQGIALPQGTLDFEHRWIIKKPRRSFMRVKKALTLALFCLVAAPLLEGQIATDDEIKFASQPYIPQETNAIRLKSTMVPVGVVVRDSHGNVVSGLKKEDFEIYDEGKKQNISLFTVELAHPPAVQAPDSSAGTTVTSAPAVPPRYIGMYFDDENMPMPDMLYARKAAEAFVRNNLEETDQIGIFTSSTTVTQQFTSNKQELLDALGKLLSHKRSASVIHCPNITPYQAFQIDRFVHQHTDALDLAMAEARQCHVCGSDCENFVVTKAAMVLSLSEQFAQDSLGVLGDVIRYMGKMPGRRNLIMASSGFFSDSETVQFAQDKMIDSAIRAGIVINTLDAKGLVPDDLNGAAADGVVLVGPMEAYADMLSSQEREVADDVLAALADGTGGKFFHNSNDLISGLRQLAELPEVSYVLGFSPEESKNNGAKHSLKVKVPGQHNINITARPSYIVPTKEEAAPAAKFQKLNREVMASDTVAEMAAHVNTESGTLATGESALRVIAHVDGRSLSFKKENKRHNERVIFITSLFDLQGHFLAGTEAVMDMTLKDATHAQIARDGVNAKATLQAPPGTYRLREVMQEVVGGRIAASNHQIEIR
jgi:VWFA-related protein